MPTVAQEVEMINIPSEREAYRAFISGLDEATRRLLFGVARGAEIFRCSTNGRQYESTTPPVLYDHPTTPYISTTCYWCDTHGRVRGEAGFDRGKPQVHCNPIVEEGDAAPQALCR